MMPSLFVAHGAPLLAIENNSYTQALQQLSSQLPRRPRAIVMFSAHWEAFDQMVGTMETFPTIHDFGGFPQELYEIQYPAKGDEAIAQETVQLLRDAGVPVGLNTTRGLDHGHWVVLRHIFPQADVPVVALSVNPNLTVVQQYAIGKALSPLRQKDVLIVGSGGTIHNFSYLNMRETSEGAFDWALQFEEWLQQTLTGWKVDELARYRELAPHAEKAVPVYGSEHFVPLVYAMGAADDERAAQRLHMSFRYGSLSHTIWQFGHAE
ncbi:dioxygenase [Brevibacillus agri]|uniref:Dioxygenase n=1 Tax=Brevibacillus agri TaxID=51101 RepID=A0A3M8AJM7_9BACL|nr:class III extradiol ring-cleavage dioxygenase [Brevibacillus agri]MBG9566990.1 MFS transporter [Brevibacillus agri]MDR9503966.1 class III extradiol ring-cleavage dioxygenase [Brevibacillus agri]MED1643624.1 class III extradiol ring-cleavage dioxygenase [Brevibacillus agri]MED1657443.1 class III extradiol ring-cleavage dioxygenase [Brevibacillus agri]MED1687977.1 class III extradiol ring-cleavage dioxygenase [Brevibacillus agri]